MRRALAGAFGVVFVIVVTAIVAFLVGLVSAPTASAMCIPGHVTLLPKPSVQLPRCDTPPGP